MIQVSLYVVNKYICDLTEIPLDSIQYLLYLQFMTTHKRDKTMIRMHPYREIPLGAITSAFDIYRTCTPAQIKYNNLLITELLKRTTK